MDLMTENMAQTAQISLLRCFLSSFFFILRCAFFPSWLLTAAPFGGASAGDTSRCFVHPSMNSGSWGVPGARRLEPVRTPLRAPVVHPPLHEAMLPLNIYQPHNTRIPTPTTKTHYQTGREMSSTGVIVRTCFVLMCLAAELRASAAVSIVAGGNGIMYIPSNDSLAHCPSSCGNSDISYPFGIGPGCFRQGFELTCNYSARPPKLYLGNSTTQLTGLYVYASTAFTPIFFNITMRPGMNTYNMSWESPAMGITIGSYNTFYVIGCDFDVTLSEYGTGDLVGSCSSRCDGEKVPNGGPCNGRGCCPITLPRDLTGFLSTLVRADATAAQSDQLHPGVMAFMSSREYYMENSSDLFSSWTNASKIVGAGLSIPIMDQPSCESAQSNNATYACSTNSNCENASSGGYYCYCSGYEQANPYLMNGCIDYNPKHKEHCPTSCGNMTIPFPFGLQEGCFANERFQINCTAGNLTVFDSGDAHYHVTGVSVEDGTLTVSNMLSDTRSEEEVIIVQTGDNGGVDVEGPVEDQFDFSLEYDIVIRWAVANLTCPMAMQKNNMYACRSVHSYCCKCSSGFQGNPYLQDGCIDVDECQLLPPNLIT